MKGLLTPVALAILLTLTACGSEKSAKENLATSEEYLASANQYLASGEQNAAVIELKNALRQAPDNYQARMLLGDIYYQKGAFSAAEKEYRQALSASSNANLLAPKLALTYYKNAKLEEIEKLTRKYPNLSSEASATLSAVQALSYFRRGKQREAKEMLSIAEQQQADNIYTRLGQATLTASSQDETPEKRIELAMEIVDEVLATAPDTIEALLLRGHLLMSKSDFAAAEESFTKVAELAPESPQYALYQIQSQMRQDKYQEAEPAIDKLLKLSPEHPMVNEYKARIYFAQKDFHNARIHAEKAVQNGSTTVSSHIIAGITCMQEKDLEQAYRYLSEIQGNIPDNHPITRIFARLQLELGHTDEAVETLDRISELTEADVALLTSATAELAKSGDKTKALSYAKKAASLDETGASTLKLGILKLANEDQSGIADLEQAIKDNPNLTEARLALIYSQLQQGQTEAARQTADEMFKADPHSPNGYTIKGLVEKRLGNVNKAAELFDKALSIAPDDATALLSKANLLESQNKQEEAYALLKKSVKVNANKPHAIKSFMAFAAKYKKTEDATQFLKGEYQNNSENIYLIWAYATALASTQKQTESIGILNKIEPEKHIPQTRKLLGDLYIQTRQLGNAEKLFEQWLAIEPKSAVVYHRLIGINETQKDYATALRYSQSAVKLFPKNTMFKLLEATMLFENDKAYAASKVLADLDKKAQQHPIATRLKARIAQHEKRPEKSLTLWKQYYQQVPSVNSLVLVANAYTQNSQSSKAIEFIESELDKFPNTAPAHLKLGDLYLQQHPDKALTHYQEALKESPNNVVALNNVSWLLVESGQYKKAEVHAKKAYKLSKQHPDIADTYGLSLLRQKRFGEALPILKAAYEAKTSSAELTIHYAEALIEQNQKSKAKSILRTTVPKDKKLQAEKEQLMKRL